MILIPMEHIQIAIDSLDIYLRYNIFQYDYEFEYSVRYRVFDDYDDTAAHYLLCPECKQRVIDEYKEKHPCK